MTAPLSRLDHVIIAVRDLEAGAKTFTRLGFRLTPLGLHEGKGTGNRCVMFQDSYVELLGIVDQKEAKGRLGELIASRGEGGIGVAFGADDADEAAAAIKDEGLAVEPPQDLARPLDLDGKRETVRFRNVMLPGLQPKVLIQFVCVHVTPELTRARHEWQLHANGADGLSEVVIHADDPATLRADYAKLFGEAAIREAAHGFVVRLANLGLAVMTRVGLQERFGPHAADGGPTVPCVAALSVRVKEIDAAGAILDMAGVDFKETPHGLIVPAKKAHGMVVEFISSH